MKKLDSPVGLITDWKISVRVEDHQYISPVQYCVLTLETGINCCKT